MTASKLALVAILGLGVAACSGSKGDAGAPGVAGPPGPTGPPSTGTPSVPVVTTAKSITARISGVTVAADTKATVRFTLRSELDLPLRGLTAANVRFVFAQLRAGTSGGGSEWRAYTTRRDGSQVQANAEAANTTGGVFRDNGDGSYDYTFAKALNTYGPDGATYDANLTHRVGLELRSTTDVSLAAAANAPYTFVPSTGSTTTLAARREIVDNDTCFACHDRLEFHGGPRTDVQYCTTCHNPGTTDGQAPNNTLDMTVMTHKIHMGAKLASGYKITGFGNTVYEFGGVVFTQDQRNCTTCHQESDTDTPQASNWRTVPYARACGACHDNVNFQTGQGHSAQNLPATDDQCVTCHGADSTIANGTLRADVAHRIPEQLAAKTFKFEVVRVAAIKADGTAGATPCAASVKACLVLPGEFPLVTVKVSNPQTGAVYQITDPAFTNRIGTTAARLRARVAHTTENFVNRGSGSNPSQPVVIDFLATTVAPMGAPPAAGGAPSFDAAAGTYTKAAGVPIPLTPLIGSSGEVFLEGRTIVDVNPFDPSPTPTPQLAELGVTSSDGVVFPLRAGTTAVARRPIVDVKRCNDCHNTLSFHGDNRNNQTELCATCHNPELASGATLATGAPFDFKVLVHGIHAGTYKYGSIDFTSVTYPGKLNNCEGCHKPDTYYPVDPTKVFATTFALGASNATPVDDIAKSPNSAVCSGCHTSTTALQHMQQNGGDLNAAGLPNKNADGTLVNAVETCQLCHGPGRSSDVKQTHKIGSFEFRAPVAN